MLDAIDQAKKALEIDPYFGLAWRYLAEAYLIGRTVLPPSETGDFKEKGNEALQHARDLAPEMPEFLLDTATEYQNNGNYMEAERIYRHILDEQLFSIASVSGSYGRVLICVGRISDALSYLKRAKRLNPMDAQVSFYLSLALLHSKRVDESLAEASLGQKLEGFGTVFSHIELAAALESNDRPEAAAIINANYSLEGDYPDEIMLRLEEIVLKEDTEAVLSELRELSKESDVSPLTMMVLAAVASWSGDPQLAFDIYRKSQFFDVPTAIWMPFNKGVRQLPAFKNWAREIGLYDYWRTSGDWGDFCQPVDDDDFVCD
jgi:tetratricopeptide (TPR) repeat protein